MDFSIMSARNVQIKSLHSMYLCKEILFYYVNEKPIMQCKTEMKK